MAEEKEEISPEQKSWREELASRRQESIQNAIRNFAVSRQFLCEGTLSTSERLIRFYEAVAMSLDQSPDPKKFEAAIDAFRAVTQYAGRDPDSGSEMRPRNTSSTSEHVLERQALYNIAVLKHRQLIYAREQPEPPPRDDIQLLYQQGKQLYQLVIQEAAGANGWSDPPSDDQLRGAISKVDFATYLAARVAYILLVTDQLMNTASFPANVTLAKEAEQSCRETESLLEKVIKLYPEVRKQPVKPGSPAQAKEASKKATSWVPWRASRSEESSPPAPSSYIEDSNSEHILKAMQQQLKTAGDILSKLTGEP